MSLKRLRRLLSLSDIEDAFQKTMPQIKNELNKAYQTVLQSQKGQVSYGAMTFFTHLQNRAQWKT